MNSSPALRRVGVLCPPGTAMAIGRISPTANRPDMDPALLFACLFHALTRYDDAVVLWKLIAFGALERPYRVTTRRFARQQLHRQLDYRKVQHVSRRLQHMGLIKTTVHPNTWTEYRVVPDKLHSLLRQGMAVHSSLTSSGELPPSVIAMVESVMGGSDRSESSTAFPPSEAAASVSGPSADSAPFFFSPGA